MSSLVTASTDTVKPRDRLLLWRDCDSALFGRRLRVSSDGIFQGRFEYSSVANITLCKITASSHRIEHVAASENRSEKSWVKIVFQIRGKSHRRQFDRSVQLSSGEWTIHDMSKPYVVLCLEDSEILVLMMPTEMISSRLYNLSELTLRRFSGTSGVSKAAYQFVQNIFGEIVTLRSEFEREIIDTISYLLRLSLRDLSPETTLGSQKSITCNRIKSYIVSNLRDPELNIDQIAETIRCSKRYLHRAFEEEESSISEYIWQLRLDRCRVELLNPASQGKSITDIAFSWGFNSCSHFSTAFKHRFGMPPSGCLPNASALGPHSQEQGDQKHGCR